MVIDGLIQQAEQQTLALLRQAEDHYGIRLPVSGIHFDLKGKTAGMVVFPPGKHPHIRYNPYLLLHNQDEFLAQTLAHEVAHLVTHRLFGRKIRPHGREWQSVMAYFGVDPARCHDYQLGDSPTRKIRRFAYGCGCQQHQLSTIRHNRILRGQTYLCKRCGESLRPLK